MTEDGVTDNDIMTTTTSNRLLMFFGAFAICLPFAGCDEETTQKISDNIERAEAAADVAIDQGLTAVEKRIGASRVAIAHLEREKTRRRNNVIEAKSACKDLEQQILSLQQQLSSNLVSDAAKDVKAAQITTLKEELEKYKENANRAEANYKHYLVEFEQKKAELKLAETKLERLRSELNSSGHGTSGINATRADELLKELQSACNKLESEIELNQIEQ